MTTEVTVPSGGKVKINEASLEQALALQDEIDLVLLKHNLDLSQVIQSFVKFLDAKREAQEEGYRFGELYSLKGVPEILATATMAIKSSKTVRDKVFKCLERSTFNDEKITPATFDVAERRGDYYPVFMAAIKENVLPFFTHLIFGFLGQV